MGTITGLTAERMQEIIDNTIASAAVVGDNLILTLEDGSTVNAGSVRGPTGATGPTGGAAIVDSIIPIGSEMIWPGTLASIPTNYLLENGSIISRTTYATLFSVLGTTWNTGGESGTQFRLPDSRGKVVVGAGGSYTVGNYGGENTHILTIGEMPSHVHSLTPVLLSPGAASAYLSGGGLLPTSASGAYNSGSAGSGGSHNNMQQFAAKHVIIRAL